MTLEKLGYKQYQKKLKEESNPLDVEIGRVITEHKERYIVKNEQGEFEAEITGNLRFTAQNREDFPAVGDWVTLTTYDNNFAIIHKVLPRFSVIQRQAVSHTGDVQIIATNIDFAFLVQAVDRDFNLNRLERYITICNSGKVNPVIVLTKTDLIDNQQLEDIILTVKKRIKATPVVAISNLNQNGINELKETIEKEKTYCLLGSSGVGKSTLLNNLTGKEIMKTGAISDNTNKGRHVTSHRELIILENGGLLIDNPGMREVGIINEDQGIENTFDQIIEIARQCKFKDCTHTTEKGCAVIMAVMSGELDEHRYQNYLKMEKENTFLKSTLEERRRKEKSFGKVLKDYKKTMKKNQN